MKKTGIFLSVMLGIAVFSSCHKITGKGDIVSENRIVTAYTGINLSIEGDVYYTPDSIYSLEIIAQQNVIDAIETFVESGRLIIKLKDHTILGKHDPIQININAPHVSAFDLSGSAAFHLFPVIQENQVSLGISGSGNIDAATIHSDDLQVNISGSGNVVVTDGSTNFEHLNISGSGNIDLVNVVADTVYATISGSGDIRVTVIKYLDGTISGSGNIRYLGNPIINAHISGSGTIEPL
jgi:hypothetical protein